MKSPQDDIWRRLPRWLARLWWLLIVAVAISACSATVTRTDGSTYEARIVRSTSAGLYLASEEGERFVAGSSIRDIDHPGNVLAIVGASIMVVDVAVAGSEGANLSPVTVGLNLALFATGATIWAVSWLAAQQWESRR